MSGSNDDDVKLREYRRLDRLHREQLAEEYNLKSESNTLRQNAGGFSLVNVQWASFATVASANFVVAIISLAVLICCWLRAKGMRRNKHHHRHLLWTISSAIVPGPPSRERSSAPESRSPGIHLSEAAKWVRLGKCAGSLPSCPGTRYPAAVSPVSRQSPMMGHHWSGEGTLSTPALGQTLGKRSPTTAVLPLPSLHVSSRSAMMNRSQGERVPGGQLPSGRPQYLAPPPGRDSPLPPLSRSQRRNSSLFPLGGCLSTPQSQLFTPSGKLSGRRDQPECFPE